MKIFCISDTHTKHDRQELNEYLSTSMNSSDVNILVHAGDLTNIGEEKDIQSFLHWFQNIQGFEAKIFIAGNHDFTFQHKPPFLVNYINEENLSQSDCIYLEDSECMVNGVKFYGSPWQPWFCDWAFNLPRNGKELEEVWVKIPEDTDVLITHTPPFGILDKTPMTKGNVGCEKLMERILVVKPKLHVFGHIHSARGLYQNEDTAFVNACVLDDYYHYKSKPIVIDFDEETKTIKNIQQL